MGVTALFGGSFDPVHNGHLAVARQVAERYGVGRLWFVPAAISPLKRGRMTASDEDRLAMLRLATAGDGRFGVTDCELRRGGVSYTVDTLRQWRTLHPGDEIVFVAGMDSLLTLSRWKNYAEITDLCRFVTFVRPGYSRLPRPADLGLPGPLAERLLADVFEGELNDVSSSDIRSRVAQGLPLAGLVPPVVADYIAARGLYR